jgi:DNA-binding CsgD family transcriptional regulator
LTPRNDAASSTVTSGSGKLRRSLRGLAISAPRAVGVYRSALGDREFDRLYRDGTRMTTDQLISLALEEKEPEAPPAPGKRQAGALTPREGEIAGLVAQGLSNKEIASKLVISQRTAETHVEHILTKLGFTSRAQIAAWVAEEEARSAPQLRPSRPKQARLRTRD